MAVVSLVNYINVHCLVKTFVWVQMLLLKRLIMVTRLELTDFESGVIVRARRMGRSFRNRYGIQHSEFQNVKNLPKIPKLRHGLL